MEGFLLDFLCYLGLLLVLYFSTRIRANASIKLKIGDETLPGKVLFIRQGLLSRVGLLNTPTLPAGFGVFLSGAKSVHTKGMHYPIDLLFLDEGQRVVGRALNVIPNQKKISGPSGTRSIVELGAGTVELFLPKLVDYQPVEVIYE